MFPVSPAAPSTPTDGQVRVRWSRSRKLLTAGYLIAFVVMALHIAYVLGQGGRVILHDQPVFWLAGLFAVALFSAAVAATVGDHLTAKVVENRLIVQAAIQRQAETSTRLDDIAQAIEDLRDAVADYGARREAAGHATGIHSANGGRLSKVD